MTLEDLPHYEGFYYIGNIVEMDGSSWVEQDIAELILEEYNRGDNEQELKLIKKIKQTVPPKLKNTKYESLFIINLN
jgi:hypothetical protein